MYRIYRVQYHEVLDFYWAVWVVSPVAKKGLLKFPTPYLGIPAAYETNFLHLLICFCKLRF